MIKENLIFQAYEIHDKKRKNNGPLWENTPYEKYEKAAAKTKGCYGELIVSNFISSIYNLIVEKADNPGHDRKVNNKKTEIKFSCATDRNFNFEFMFNHVGFEKDWERIIFCGVNGDLEEKIVWFTKEDLLKTKEEGFWAHQQGGKKSENDDWMCTGNNSTKLLNHPLAKKMEEF